MQFSKISADDGHLTLSSQICPENQGNKIHPGRPIKGDQDTCIHDYLYVLLQHIVTCTQISKATIDVKLPVPRPNLERGTTQEARV